MSRDEFRQARWAAWLLDLAIALGIAKLLMPLGWIIAGVYWLLRDGLFEGQSIGKRLMGLRVVGPRNARCTYRLSAIRNVLWLLPIVDLFMAATAVMALAREPDGRHWGDRLADTHVVRTRASAHS